MRELTPLQNTLFKTGAILILAGLILWVPLHVTFAPYIFLGGSLLFAFMQLQQKYEGRSFIIKRLRRQQLTGAFFLIVAGLFMTGSLFHIPYTTRNEWIVGLTIGCIFELYTSFRIPAELKKEQA